MDRVYAVRLILLEIIRFKQLEPGKLEWNHGTRMKFDVIHSQRDKNLHTQIFQAFQFGFGCDTIVQQAGVIVTLRQNDQMIYFSHYKSSDSNHTYSIKIDGIDEDFRMVDRLEYIDELVKLKVFASTMSFMFGSNLQCILPKHDHDLRRHLEKHLMNKPNLLNDYDDIVANLQTDFEGKKSITDTIKIVDEIQKGIEFDAEKRRQKAEAAVGERDLKFLQVFQDSKLLEELSAAKNELQKGEMRVGALNVQKEQVVDQLKNWDAKMDEFASQKLINEARNNCALSSLKHWQKEIKPLQTKIQSLEQLSGTHSVESVDNVGMCDEEIELDDARVMHKDAELSEKISKIDADVDALMHSHRNSMKNVEKKSGQDLINIESIDHHPTVDHMNQNQEIFHEMDSGPDYDEEPYTFRIPSLNSRNDVQEYLIRIPVEGIFIIKTPDLKTNDFIGSWLKTAQYRSKKRIITVISCDKKDKKSYDKKPPQVSVEAKKKLVRNPNPRDPATSKIRELTKKIEKKAYITGTSVASNTNEQFVAAQENLKQHEENLKRLEQKLAAKYLDAFPDLFQQNNTVNKSDPKAVLNFVETWKQFRNFSISDAGMILAMIKDMRNEINTAKKMEQQYNDLLRQRMALDLEDLKNEGEEIVENVDRFVTRPAVVTNEALASALRETIDCRKVQLTKWDLPFDPAQETSAQAYYDCMAPQDKPTLASNEWMGVRGAVESKMNEIEEVLPVLKTKDAYLQCTAQEMIKLKKEMRTLQREQAKKMVEKHSILKNRNEAFGPHFLMFKQYFHVLVEYCRPKWGVRLEFSAVDDFPLGEPIRLMVDDPTFDRALRRTMTLNHSIAALILHLAINIAIGSQFIIVDGLDDFIEPCLIDPIMQLLEQLFQIGIQIIFIKMKPEKGELAVHTYHTWAHEKNLEQTAETTGIIMDDDVDMADSSVSRFIGSTASSLNE